MNFIRLLFTLLIIFIPFRAYSFDINAPLGDRLSPYDEGLGPYGPSVLNSPLTSQKNNISFSFSMTSIKLKKMYLQKMKQYSAGVSYSATDNLELSATAGISKAMFDKSHSGISDIFTTAKYNPQYKSCNLAYILGVNIPSGDKDIYGSNNGIDISFDAPYQVELDFAAFNASAGFTVMDISKNSETSFNAGLGLSRSVSDKIALSLETTYTIYKSNLDFNVYVGLKYKINKTFQLQAVCGRQIDENIINSVIGTGLSINL